MNADRSPPLLIVEDDPALQKQIKWSLDRFESITASDRDSALLQCRRHSPAVVTMDLGLPPDPDSVSEGFKLLEQMLQFDPDIKVVVLTGQNDHANALRAITHGHQQGGVLRSLFNKEWDKFQRIVVPPAHRGLIEHLQKRIVIAA